MIEEEEIYRQKYLKYKKKYLTALENMTGGAENEPIRVDSTIYFCLEKTYNRLQISGRKNGLIKGRIGGDNCFIERLSMPLMSLVLSKSLTGNWELKTIDGKECNFLNYPFLCGRKFGMVEVETAPAQGLKEKTKALFASSGTFNAALALKQIQEFQPLILKKLLEINQIGKQEQEKVYYLHTYGSNVSFNGILEYKAFPTTHAYSLNPTVLTQEGQQGGGGAKYYICNNEAAQAIETHYKNINLDNTSFQAIVTDCLDDIALDDLVENSIEPQFGMLDELATTIYVRKTTTRRNAQLERKVLPDGMVFGQKTETVTNLFKKQVEKKSFDEQIALDQFEQIIQTLGWGSEVLPISIYKLTTSFGKTGNIKTLTRIVKKE